MSWRTDDAVSPHIAILSRWRLGKRRRIKPLGNRRVPQLHRLLWNQIRSQSSVRAAIHLVGIAHNPRREWKINPKQPLSGIGWRTMLVARNERPNPQPPNAKVEPIPTQWPNAKVEPIPTQWPDFKLAPITIESISPVMLKAPADGDSK